MLHGNRAVKTNQTNCQRHILEAKASLIDAEDD